MLKLENVTKIFAANTVNEKIALKNINLNIYENDFVTVIGGNGAGKSTLLNAIAGSFIIDSGKIVVDDIDVTNKEDYERAKYIGRVFQDPRMGTATKMTIEENLAIAYRRGKKRSLRWGISNKERDLFKTHLEKLGLGLENRLSHKVGLLSGGQRQALTLMMATLIKPRLLLLDEHTAALDPKTARIVIEITQKIIKEDNLTALMITHNMKDAIKSGNRIAMMHEGSIILDIKNDEKQNITVNDLLQKFEQASGEEIDSDRMLLS